MLSFNTSNMYQSTTSRESYTALSLPSILLSTTFKELSSFFRESLFCLTTATKERKIGNKQIVSFVLLTLIHWIAFIWWLALSSRQTTGSRQYSLKVNNQTVTI